MLPGRHHRVQRIGSHGITEKQERIRGVQTLRALGVFDHARQIIGRADFGHGEARVITVGQFTDALKKNQGFRLADVVQMLLHGGRQIATLLRRFRRVIAQLQIMAIVIRGIQAEAIDAALQPEATNLQNGVLHFPVVEVQIRHLRQEIMQIVLLAARLPGPGGATHPALPVRWRAAVVFGIGPHIPIGLGVIPALPAFLEPRMLDGGVTPDLIDDDLQTQRVRVR